MTALTRWVLAHKKIVVIAWIALAVAGMMAAGPATDALESEFSVPGREGWETNVAIAERYQGTGGDAAPLVPVVTLPEGRSVDDPRDPRARPARRAAVRRAAQCPDRLLRQHKDASFVSEDGQTTFAIVYPQPDPTSAFGENPGAARAAAAALEGARVAGRPVHLTGLDALFEDSGDTGGGSGVLIEAVVGGVGALLVLSFVFASFLAVVPLVMAVVRS